MGPDPLPNRPGALGEPDTALGGPCDPLGLRFFCPFGPGRPAEARGVRGSKRYANTQNSYFSSRFQRVQFRRNGSDLGRFWVFRFGNLPFFGCRNPDRVRVGASKNDESFFFRSGSVGPSFGKDRAILAGFGSSPPGVGLGRLSAAGTPVLTDFAWACDMTNLHSLSSSVRL